MDLMSERKHILRVEAKMNPKVKKKEAQYWHLKTKKLFSDITGQPVDVSDIDLTLGQLEGELRDGTSCFNVSHGRKLILFSLYLILKHLLNYACPGFQCLDLVRAKDRIILKPTTSVQSYRIKGEGEGVGNKVRLVVSVLTRCLFLLQSSGSHAKQENHGDEELLHRRNQNKGK